MDLLNNKGLFSRMINRWQRLPTDRAHHMPRPWWRHPPHVSLHSNTSQTTHSFFMHYMFWNTVMQSWVEIPGY